MGALCYSECRETHFPFCCVIGLTKACTLKDDWTCCGVKPAKSELNWNILTSEIAQLGFNRI